MNLVTAKEDLVVLDKSMRMSHVEGPRMREINDEKVEEIKNSILEVGVINPITIIAGENSFTVVAGSHRWEAICRIWDSSDNDVNMPAKVIAIDPANVLEYQIRENLERNDLTASEKVEFAEKLKEQYDIRHGGGPGKKTMKEIAAEMGIPLRTLQRMNYVKKNGDEFLVKAMDDKELTPGECENIIKAAKDNGTTQIVQYTKVIDDKSGEETEEIPDFLQPQKTPEQIAAEEEKETAKAKRAWNANVKLLKGDVLNMLEYGHDGNKCLVKPLESLIRYIKKAMPEEPAE